MSGGLRYESLADMPEGMLKQVAKRIVAGSEKAPAMSAPEWLSKVVAVPKAKYGNVKTEANGIKFDSKKEAQRYTQLITAQEAGVIEDLRLQVDFTLQEAYTTPTGERIRAIRYKADFTYKVKSAGYDAMPAVSWQDIEYWRSLWPGAMVVEDVKSRATQTKEYQIKKKMMADKGYTIREV